MSNRIVLDETIRVVLPTVDADGVPTSPSDVDIVVRSYGGAIADFGTLWSTYATGRTEVVIDAFECNGFRRGREYMVELTVTVGDNTGTKGEKFIIDSCAAHAKTSFYTGSGDASLTATALVSGPSPRTININFQNTGTGVGILEGPNGVPIEVYLNFGNYVFQYQVGVTTVANFVAAFAAIGITIVTANSGNLSGFVADNDNYAFGFIFGVRAHKYGPEGNGTVLKWDGGGTTGSEYLDYDANAALYTFYYDSGVTTIATVRNVLATTDHLRLFAITIGGAASAAQADQVDDYVVSGNQWTLSGGLGLAVGDGTPFDANVVQHLGTAVATPSVAGVPEVDVTHWQGSAVASPSVAGVPEVDVTFWKGDAPTDLTADSLLMVDVYGIEGDTATATGNLRDAFNGTGYVADTAPAQMQQVRNIAVTSAALNAVATSRTITTGTESGFLTNAQQDDGTFWSIADVAGTTDVFAEFDLSATAGAIAVGAQWNGYLSGIANTMKVYARNWVGASWDQIGTIQGIAGTVESTLDFELTSAHTQAGLARIRFSNTGLSSSSLKTDRLLLGYAVVAPTAAAVTTAVNNEWDNRHGEGEVAWYPKDQLDAEAVLDGLRNNNTTSYNHWDKGWWFDDAGPTTATAKWGGVDLTATATPTALPRFGSQGVLGRQDRGVRLDLGSLVAANNTLLSPGSSSEDGIAICAVHQFGTEVNFAYGSLTIQKIGAVAKYKLEVNPSGCLARFTITDQANVSLVAEIPFVTAGGDNIGSLISGEIASGSAGALRARPAPFAVMAGYRPNGAWVAIVTESGLRAVGSVTGTLGNISSSGGGSAFTITGQGTLSFMTMSTVHVATYGNLSEVAPLVDTAGVIGSPGLSSLIDLGVRIFGDAFKTGGSLYNAEARLTALHSTAYSALRKINDDVRAAANAPGAYFKKPSTHTVIAGDDGGMTDQDVADALLGHLGGYDNPSDWGFPYAIYDDSGTPPEVTFSFFPDSPRDKLTGYQVTSMLVNNNSTPTQVPVQRMGIYVYNFTRALWVPYDHIEAGPFFGAGDGVTGIDYTRYDRNFRILNSQVAEWADYQDPVDGHVEMRFAQTNAGTGTFTDFELMDLVVGFTPSPDLSRVLGLLHENARVDKQTYNAAGKMLTSRLRVFVSAAAANASTAWNGATPANNAEGEIERYSIEAAYNGSNQLTSYKLVREL